ncbi:elongator complex protein 6-like [Mauremys mutica]|uniref:elongator complex protein 6-like n=1 Tax=Mauremys mutica TaxID=74926 RepID=UPI001D16413D|nr:elongator complex protein 6-like [Mauremys mutica]
MTELSSMRKPLYLGGSVPRTGARLLNGAAGPSAGTVRAVAKGEAEQKAWSRMFVELNELLNASPERPEQGKLTLLRDTKTDGSFLVHHFLSFYLKAGCKVCFVALLQSFSHYNIIAQKLGVSLTAAKERGQLVFLGGLKSCFDVLFGEEQHVGQTNPLRFVSEDGSNLKTMYEFVRTSLMASGSDSWKCPVLLVDDLSVLLSLGVRPVDVLDFIHYCRVAVCSQLKVLLCSVPRVQ